MHEQPHYLEYEKQLIAEEIPKKWNDLSDLLLPATFYLVEDEQPELWGWNLANDDRRIIVSVFSGSRKKFGQKDVAFLKLVSENLETKLLELSLIKELDEKNNIISSINRNQKKVIEEKPGSLALKIIPFCKFLR